MTALWTSVILLLGAIVRLLGDFRPWYLGTSYFKKKLPSDIVYKKKAKFQSTGRISCRPAFQMWRGV
jgi:hypothetical protein